MVESVISLSAFKSDASRLLREMQEHAEPLVLTQNGKATAIVEDYEEYRRRQQGLLMLKLVVQGESDVQQGKLTTQDAIFSALRGRLARDETKDG